MYEKLIFVLRVTDASSCTSVTQHPHQRTTVFQNTTCETRSYNHIQRLYLMCRSTFSRKKIVCSQLRRNGFATDFNMKWNRGQSYYCFTVFFDEKRGQQLPPLLSLFHITKTSGEEKQKEASRACLMYYKYKGRLYVTHTGISASITHARIYTYMYTFT